MLNICAKPSGAAMQVVSAACAAVGALASANPGCQSELHMRGAVNALVTLLAEHAATVGAEGTSVGDAAVTCSSPTAAATDSIAERAAWAVVELVAGNADLQDAVRAAHTHCASFCVLALTSLNCRAYVVRRFGNSVPRDRPRRTRQRLLWWLPHSDAACDTMCRSGKREASAS